MEADEFLAHYSSKYYDPAKAREYYLRTRELKGRETRAPLESDEKKEKWAVVKDGINTAKKSEAEKLKFYKGVHRQQIQTKAEDAREEVRSKLKATLERLKADRERQIAALPEVPKTGSKAEKERVRLERAEALAKINGETKSERAKTSEEASVSRNNIGTMLKAAAQKAQVDYNTLMSNLKSKYAAEEEREYKKIQNS